ncbi:MAG: TonB-dependent receptor [Verrucomicrobia bacterium]|nr:TonB-dependent receptor [Cytophagales bacterium]
MKPINTLFPNINPIRFCIIAVFLLALSLTALSQTVISGKITDDRKQAIIGASVFLKGTYDGISTDTTGFFRFTTAQKDTGTLVISYLGYLSVEQKIELPFKGEVIVLKEDPATLAEVTITAGTFEASDEKRSTILKPIDIVTTAGAGADIFKALQVLPGASQVGEQEGLFVRGGSASETKAVIDGLIVQNPFFSSVPNVAQRGRFSPFQFKGTAFSTGGYSAQYGQALSSVLLLNTNDLPAKSSFNAGLNIASVYGGFTERWKKSSLDFNVNYFNVGPVLFNLNKQNIDFQTAPQGTNVASNFRHQTSKTGLLKVYVNFSDNKLGITYQDVTTESGKTSFALKNYNFYSNATYTETFGKYRLNIGFSQSFNEDKLKLDSVDAGRSDKRTQLRLVLSRDIGQKVTLNRGVELHYAGFSNRFDSFLSQFNDLYFSYFTEADINFSKKLIGRIGIRTEHSQVIRKWNFAPRASLAYKTGDYSQISLAYGEFYQNPTVNYLYINKNLNFEKATHFILNYQIQRNERTFRVETYRKNYQSLVRESVSEPFDANAFRFPYGQTDNSGYGYAQGLDVFFRDKKTLENAEYWISYSYLDTKRLFANYLTQVTPTFASEHNLNVLFKKYIPKITTQVNATYSYSSGRTYFNPNNPIFLADRTPDFHNLSLSFNYLTAIKSNFMVVYAEVGNVLGTQNVFGYRYSADGTQRIATNAPTFRSFFIGTQITINKPKKN